MENFYLSDVVSEVAEEARNRVLRRVWQAGNLLFFDFRLSRGLTDVLVASLEPTRPLLFFYRPSKSYSDKAFETRAKDEAVTPFLLLLRSRLVGAKLAGVRKPPYDRVVAVEFEDGPDPTNPDSQLRLVFAGHSCNALLVSADGKHQGALRNGAEDLSDQILADGARTFDVAAAFGVSDDSSVESILAAWFGPRSPLGPLMRKEFEARAESSPPALAFTTLIEDIFRKPHSPLLYHRFPLDSCGARQIKAGRDLVLAPFRLAFAAGLSVAEFPSFSEAATEYFVVLSRSQAFQRRLQTFASKVTARLKARSSTLEKIESDLTRFEDPEKLKRYGDLILASVGSAKIEDGKIRLKDYFEAGEPEIEIEADDAKSLQEAASHYYDLYRKGRRTREMLIPRRDIIKSEIQALTSLLDSLSADPSESTLDECISSAEKTLQLDRSTPRDSVGKKGDRGRKIVGRRFISSDGYEIVVGRNEIENDEITFRIAGSQDAWLHAADYPGSHVVIRNPTRKPITHKTLIEAAEIAAFHSQAKREGKVAVNHTQKKFVSKPPKAKPGLVRISSFKTLIVQPRCDLKRVGE